MKTDKIIKAVIGSIAFIGIAGLSLNMIYSRDSIHGLINEEVTIRNQADYNMFVQLKITPVVEMTQDVLAMRKIHTTISVPDYTLKIDRAVEGVDIAISDMMKENVTENQRLLRDRTIGSLNKLRSDLNLLKGRLNEIGEGESVFDFHNDAAYEQIYTSINNSLMEIDDYIGLGEEIRQNNDGIQR